jgi:hypothetical protein
MQLMEELILCTSTQAEQPEAVRFSTPCEPEETQPQEQSHPGAALVRERMMQNVVARLILLLPEARLLCG